LLGYFLITEMNLLRSDYLIRFVAFAGNHYDIIAACRFYPKLNCSLPVGLDYDPLRIGILKSGHYIINYLFGSFGPRVITGDNHGIRPLFSRSRHSRAFGSISVAAAAENSDQPGSAQGLQR